MEARRAEEERERAAKKREREEAERKEAARKAAAEEDVPRPLLCAEPWKPWGRCFKVSPCIVHR